MRSRFTFVSFVVIGLVALLNSGPVSAEGRICPVDHGACFFPVGTADFIVLFDGSEDVDNDGDTDYIVTLFDGFNDWVRQNPDGSLSFHLQNRLYDLIYCPFDINVVGPPNDECVYGAGRLRAVGTFAGPLGACPGVVHIRDATGVRLSDGKVFNFEAEFQVRASDCETGHKFRITAEEAD